MPPGNPQLYDQLAGQGTVRRPPPGSTNLYDQMAGQPPAGTPPQPQVMPAAAPTPVTGPGLQKYTPPPAQPAPQPPAGQPPTSPDPFAAMGGGVNINGAWIPKNNPAAIAAAGGPSGAGTPGSPTTASANPLGDAFRTALMARLQANPAPTSIADDPVLAAQSGAMRQASARQAARDRSAAVEAAGAGGLSATSGGTQGALRKLEADRAFNEGQFDANLLGDARGQRMQELQSFLAIAGDTLSDQDRLALERELGTLDADIRRQGITSQTNLGMGDLNLRGELGRGQLNQNLLSILLNNRQANDQLGLQAGQIGLNANTQALLAMMGGGR